MSFDIYALDKLKDYDEDEEKLEAYQNGLHELFLESPEGLAQAEIDSEMGFWSYQSVYYAYAYIGVTPPQMETDNMEELLLEVFPRKISVGSPDELTTAVPEIVAFWQFLQRVYQLPNARQILGFLQDIQPAFMDAMQDPAYFGMAKSFFMQGQAAGFDMTDETQINQFMYLYNLAALQGKLDAPLPDADMDTMLDMFDGEKRPSNQPALDKRKKARDARKRKKKRRRRR